MAKYLKNDLLRYTTLKEQECTFMKGGGGPGTMYELIVRNRFAAAHALRDYEGPCARLHGHTWQVEVVVKGRHLDRRGMLVDFTDIKTSVKNILGELDHRNLNDLEPFSHGGERNPTAENLARFIFNRLKAGIVTPDRDVQIAMVRVWESPDASAAYMEVE